MMDGTRVVLDLTVAQHRNVLSGLAKLFGAARREGVVLTADEQADLGQIVYAEPGCQTSTTLDSAPVAAAVLTWLTVRETRLRLGISKQAVHAAIERGSLAERPGRIRGPRLVDEASVIAYEAARSARRAG